MNNWKKDLEVKKYIYVLSVSGIIIASFVLAMMNITRLQSFINSILKTLSPFIWGILFALIMSSFASFIERKMPKSMSEKAKRLISSIISVLALIVMIVSFIAFLIPQLLDSVYSIGTVVNNFINGAEKWTNGSDLTEFLPKEVVDLIYNYSNALIKGIWDFAQGAIPSIVSVTFTTFNNLMNFVIGFIVAIYILVDRDSLRRSFGRLFKALLDEKSYDWVHHTFFLTIEKFYKFFIGKVVDSIIIGILCAVVLSLLDFEYVGLISFIVGVTNIVPFFGPFIGAIPSCLLLLMVNPFHSLLFTAIILVIQQIDGNIIGPYILGDSVGLSSLAIMFAIIVGGAYFGFAGMILGVPLFAVIYVLISEYVDKQLTKKDVMKKQQSD